MQPVLNILRERILFSLLYCHQQPLFSASEGKTILSALAASGMGIHIFMLLVFFMLDFIHEGKCIVPKGFLFGSHVFIYVSLTILTMGCNKESAKSPRYPGSTCVLSVMD